MRKNLNDLLYKLSAQATTEILDIKRRALNPHSIESKIIIVLIIVFGAGLLTMSITFGDDLFTRAGKIISDIYGKLITITGGIAALAILCCLIWRGASPSDDGAKSANRWMKRIIISYIAILILGSIFKIMADVTIGAGLKVNSDGTVTY